MKTQKYIFIFISLLVIVSCKKDPITVPVKFTSTTYQTLGSYDASGKPSYLAPADIVSPTLLSFVNSTLQEKQDLRGTHPELLTTKAIADIAISTSSDVFITYISNGTGNHNTFAFYTYTTGQSPTSTKDIKTITYVFPNVGKNTTLQPGDKVKIGRFDAGISIGFVILKNSWDINTKTVDSGAVHFCSNDILNPEVDPDLKKHAVLINYPAENKVLIGFEDVDRTEAICDNDFNDMMFYCTVVP